MQVACELSALVTLWLPASASVIPCLSLAHKKAAQGVRRADNQRASLLAHELCSKQRGRREIARRSRPLGLGVRDGGLGGKG